MTLQEVLKKARAEMQIDILRDKDGVLRAVKRYATSPGEEKRLAIRVNTAFDAGAAAILIGGGDPASRQQAIDVLNADASVPQSVAEETADAFLRVAWQFAPPPQTQARRPLRTVAQSQPKTPPQSQPQQPVKRYPANPAPGCGGGQGGQSGGTGGGQTQQGRANPAPSSVSQYISTRSQLVQDIYDQIMNGS